MQLIITKAELLIQYWSYHRNIARITKEIDHYEQMVQSSMHTNDEDDDGDDDSDGGDDVDDGDIELGDRSSKKKKKNNNGSSKRASLTQQRRQDQELGKYTLDELVKEIHADNTSTSHHRRLRRSILSQKELNDAHLGPSFPWPTVYAQLMSTGECTHMMVNIYDYYAE